MTGPAQLPGDQIEDALRAAADNTPIDESTGGYRQMRFVPPPGATEIYLVRHGESEPAVPGRSFPMVDGHGDPALAPQGLEQAERVGERLGSTHFDAVYVTTLRRTHQTAAPLLQRLGVEAEVEADLREVSLGEWDGGLYRQRLSEGHPLAMRMIHEERWDVIPGAEPMEVFTDRVQGAMDRLVAAHVDQRIAVFTHGGVIGEVLRQVVQTPRRFAFVGADNGSISTVVSVAGRWLIRGFNDTSHL
ncbi:MAG: histidine phosphatase family protein [Acidimicrobiales bacterium]|nr:histidine phosphatase family protein [Acidimicrobiales bacterium]